MDLSTAEVGLLLVAAFAAGTIDAIAGGGGLVTLPALLAVGLPPHAALATNKGQSVVGSFAALARFARAGLVDWRMARRTFPAGFAGALFGAALVLQLNPEVLRPLVLVLLVVAGVALVVRPPRPSSPRGSRSTGLGVLGLAGVIGLYDGFFGPGTGTFLIVAMVWLLGLELTPASANAKVINFASNLAAVVTFAARGAVLWRVALPMAAAQFVGGWVGAQLAVRGGARVIRAALLVVVLGLVLKLGRDFFAA